MNRKSLDDLTRQFGEKITEKAKRDHSIDTNRAKDVITRIEKYNPTTKHPILHWLVKNYACDGIRYFEDMDRANAALKIYLQFFNRIGVPIHKVKGLAHLEDLVESFKDQKDFNESEKEFAYKTSEILYDGPEGIVVRPMTTRASQYFGRGTRWCTAATESKNYFNSYVYASGFYLIYIIPRGSSEKQAIAIDKNSKNVEYFDARDETIRLKDIENCNPWGASVVKEKYGIKENTSSYNPESDINKYVEKFKQNFPHLKKFLKV